jgi:hypothetical protein
VPELLAQCVRVSRRADMAIGDEYIVPEQIHK